MRIDITHNNTDFYISVEEKTFDLYRLGKNNTPDSKNFGAVTESSLGYYTSFAKCIDSLLKSSFSTTEESVSIKEFVDRFEQGRKELIGLID